MKNLTSINNRLLKNVLNLILSFVMLSILVQNRVTKIVEYPNSDIYFDKVYLLITEQTTHEHYLRIYCKEKNMISISITKSIEFEQYPRFPINSPQIQTPRMQRKIYTFWQSCQVDIKINQNKNLIQVYRKAVQIPFFTIRDINWKDDGDIDIFTYDQSTKWGMGQRFQLNFAIKDGTWTIWNRDRPWEIDRGNTGKSAQTYGHQPVYLARSTKTNNFHLIYFKNTHGLNIESTENSNKLTYKVTGGHIHFIALVGKDPQSILKQYHNFIGPAMVPPFWSMGYHQSRWGYKDYNQFSKVVEQFQKYQLPLDTMWSDLDYMDKKQIFTVDVMKYPIEKMRELMTSKKIHYIPLIDAGVSINDRVAIEEGNKQKVFIKSIRNPKENYVGAVWPGKVHFVDYLHPNASKYWRSQLDRLYNLIPFSGVWLDMNQPSNFQGNQPCVQYYRIQHSQSINMMTIDVNLKHYCESCSNLKQKEVHAYYGHLTTVPTYEFLKSKNQRPFIISRSNSVGTGVYAGHWTGDNVATWDFLRLSISGNFLFQIFGIQMVGADICGFHYNTNQQLCSRWMQVGSFYPFSRNHNENESISQQPYRFGNKLLQTSKLSYYQRYSLLKQMYSTLVDLNGTGSYYRPIFFEFSSDNESYSQAFAQTQFLIGDYLLGTPIVSQGHSSREVYFPKGQTEQFWYQLQLNKVTGVTLGSQITVFRGGQITTVNNNLPAPLPIFLRSGRLILVNRPATRTSDLNNNYMMIAALDQSQQSRSIGTFIAANDFSNNTQIDACVSQGCSIEISVYKNTDNAYILQWVYKGKSNIEPKMLIQHLKVVKGKTVVESSSPIQISSKQGRQTISLS